MIDIDSFIGSLLQKGYEGLITLESPADFAENGGIDITKVARSIKLLKGMVKL
jgi:sugar phosphate isomerase/epimerase